MLCKLLLLCANFFQFPLHRNFGIYKNYLFTLCLETFFFLENIFLSSNETRNFWNRFGEKKKRKKGKMHRLRFDDGCNLIGNSLTAQGNPLKKSRYRRPRPRRGGRSRWGEERYADYRYLCNTLADLLRTKGQGEEGTLPGSYSFRKVSCTCRIHPRGC